MPYIHLHLPSLNKKSIEQLLHANRSACLEYINEQSKFTIFCDNNDSDNDDYHHHYYKNS